MATIVSDADDMPGRSRPSWPRQVFANADLRNEKINFRCASTHLAKGALPLVVGRRREAEEARLRSTLGNDQQQVLTLAEAVALIRTTEATPPVCGNEEGRRDWFPTPLFSPPLSSAAACRFRAYGGSAPGCARRAGIP